MAHTMRQDWMCQYTGKLCYNPRATSARRHGSIMLRLCTFHRALANRNQYRYQQRQRLLRRLAESNSLPSPAMSTCTTSHAPSSSTPGEPGCETESSGANARLFATLSSIPFGVVATEPDDVSELIEEVDAMIHSWENEQMQKIPSDTSDARRAVVG